jgi:outer membrane protein, heavy metal efflux system
MMSGRPQFAPSLVSFLLPFILGFAATAGGQPAAVARAAESHSPAAAHGRPAGAAAADRLAPDAASAGASSLDLVRRALASNAELAAARLEVDRARARLRQAGLRPNPTLDFEQQRGVFNAPGERLTTVGVSLPLELGGKRGRRVDLARVELEVAEAAVAERERRLMAEVRAVYAEALAAARELGTEQIRVVEARVVEGETAPLEANLLRVEIDRLRSRRALVEGRLQATLFRLKALAGIALTEPLTVREELAQPALAEPPASPETAVELALRTRPDLRLARLAEEAAQAGYRLAQAQGVPDLTVSARYGTSLSTFDSLPGGPLSNGSLNDSDKLLAVGVSIPLPLFNRNQGARAEAQTMIAQAASRRAFVEAVVRSEVAAAYARYRAAEQSLAAFEQGVLARSRENIRAIRAAYEAGAYRVTELIAEQRRLLDAEREFTEALGERYRALADLQSALGLPASPPEGKKE